MTQMYSDVTFIPFFILCLCVEFGFALGTQVDTGLRRLQFPLSKMIWVLESKDDEEHEAIMDDLSICKDELHVKM